MQTWLLSSYQNCIEGIRLKSGDFLRYLLNIHHYNLNMQTFKTNFKFEGCKIFITINYCDFVIPNTVTCSLFLHETELLVKSWRVKINDPISDLLHKVIRWHIGRKFFKFTKILRWQLLNTNTWWATGKFLCIGNTYPFSKYCSRNVLFTSI